MTPRTPSHVQETAIMCRRMLQCAGECYTVQNAKGEYYNVKLPPSDFLPIRIFGVLSEPGYFNFWAHRQ